MTLRRLVGFVRKTSSELYGSCTRRSASSSDEYGHGEWSEQLGLGQAWQVSRGSSKVTLVLFSCSDGLARLR